MGKASMSAAYRPLYTWLLITGAVLFALFLLWRYGFIDQVLEADRTGLSLVIGVIFLLSCGYLGVSALRLSRMHCRFLERSRGTRPDSGRRSGDVNAVDEYLDLMSDSCGTDSRHVDAMHAWLAEQVHKGHRLGWFISDSLIRLGLVGTVIGFIIMLGSVYSMQGDEISVLQDLLSSMGGGMQVALYTTLTGISLSLVLSVYCRYLDTGADELVGQVIRHTAGSAREGGEDEQPVPQAK